MLPDNFTHGPNQLEWITDSNYRCLITLTSTGHYCGYVCFPDDHPFAKCKDELEIPVSVHGGVTWYKATTPDGRQYKNKWWIGFDCAHSGDLTGFQFPNSAAWTDAVWRSFDYALRETISLHDQIRNAA